MFKILQKHQNVVKIGLKCQDVVNPDLVYKIEVVTKLRTNAPVNTKLVLQLT